MKEAERGDPIALQRLLVAHHDRMLRIARERIPPALRARVEPADVLQQLYVRVLQSVDGFEDRGAAAFVGWLSRILASVIVDLQRALHAEKREAGRELHAPAGDSGVDQFASRFGIDSVTPSRVVAMREAHALVLTALAGLSSDYRRVLELRYLRGYETSEVAKIMERSPDAITMLTGRAARALRASVRELSGV